MASLSTIDEVLSELDRIVSVTIRENSPLGIFAWVYRHTTAKVANGINLRRFENNERMERFDVAFASLYIDAFWHYREGQPVSSAWKYAFDAGGASTEYAGAIILQHLLLGMNAHINLDLGIAAARVSDGNIEALENDFFTINLLLEELIDELQDRVSRVSPLMFLLDLLGKRHDEDLVNWSMVKARHFAWDFACRLASAPSSQKQALIDEADEHITRVAECVAEPPGFLLPKVLSVIRYFEEKDTRAVIEALER